MEVKARGNVFDKVVLVDGARELLAVQILFIH